jgi:hypothetical protein
VPDDAGELVERTAAAPDLNGLRQPLRVTRPRTVQAERSSRGPRSPHHVPRSRETQYPSANFASSDILSALPGHFPCLERRLARVEHGSRRSFSPSRGHGSGHGHRIAPRSRPSSSSRRTNVPGRRARLTRPERQSTAEPESGAHVFPHSLAPQRLTARPASARGVVTAGTCAGSTGASSPRTPRG